MEYEANGNGDGNEGRPQLQMFDEKERETAIGTLDDGEELWHTLVIIEPVAGDLVRGRLSFRQGERRYDTAPVILEETAARVVQRAAELPRAMLRQLLMSARD
ncbi:MAG: hypothetical protein R3266_10040 [Gemmatimonadota bacterium]|nr:hypothetical protein [Gemmatimonadota bacterium]